MGMVLHGYKSYAGDPLNMSGDVQYAILKAIENGAAPYYFLVYDHATDLRTSKDLSKYYSADFSSWFAKPTDTSVKDTSIQTTYKTLNEAIGSLQNATITGHNFYTAFKLDVDEASVLFGEYIAAENALASAKAAYEAAAADTEANKSSGKLADKIRTEREMKAAYVAAQEKFENVAALIERNDVGGIVSVTYTQGTTNKTFYINYNNFEVVFEKDGKAFKMAPMSFVTDDAVKAGSVEIKNTNSKNAENAYLATTAKIVADFTTSNEALTSATSETAKNRAIKAINAVLEDATKSEAGEVVTVDYANGSVIYINYTSGNVIVKISAEKYELIPAQSYLIIE
jgi:phosphohistidine swiveling domain-containing protein